MTSDMSLRYKAIWRKKWGMKFEESEPSSFSVAFNIGLLRKPTSKTVALAQEGTGVNAGKFFLHQILK